MSAVDERIFQESVEKLISGFIPPSGREALRIMNIHSARDFAASLAAQVLAGEFNLALEISREKLYSNG